MRSSKNRSRSKSNRQRSLGNIVNRVFDSSGPEGKVRGTPQQIIDKYLTLARDAQLSNDRVAEQNFLQHAEHYTRMLGEAQREMQREQESRQHHHPEGGSGNAQGGPQNGNGGGHVNGHVQSQGGDDRGGERQGDRSDRGDRGDRGGPYNNRRRDDQRGERGDDFRRVAPVEEERVEDDGPGLVETPEARMAATPSASMMPDLSQNEAAATPAEGEPSARRGGGQRRPRKPKAKAEGGEAPSPAGSED